MGGKDSCLNFPTCDRGTWRSTYTIITSRKKMTNIVFYLLGFLRRFQHCTGHITTGSWKGRGNQYIEFARVLYCKLPTNGKQLPAFPHKALTGIEPRPQRWEARVLPLCHHGPATNIIRVPSLRVILFIYMRYFSIFVYVS